MAATAIPRVQPAPAGLLVHPAWARLVAFVPLALFGALRWAALVTPARGGDAVLALVVAVAGAGLLVTVPTTAPAARRWGTVAAVTVVLVAVALLTAGVPLRLLDPRSWGELVSGMLQGIGATPGITVPYRGVDEWVRTAIVSGATGLVCLGALLAAWPRRTGPPGHPLAAAVALTTLYAVPVIERSPDRPFLDGAVFCMLLGGFLWIERLRRDQLAVGLAGIAVVTGLGLALAPSLDGQRAWIDYQALAEKLEPTKAEAFSWDHSYGPLNWPREGREVLRVKARTSAYWKTSNLDAFDGFRWRQGSPSRNQISDPHDRRWVQRIRVIDRGLRSTQLVGAGVTERILPGGSRPGLPVAGGTFVTAAGVLRPGDSYDAIVYDPHPTDAQLRRSGTAYPGYTADFLQLDVPVAGRSAQLTDPFTGALIGANATVRFSRFGEAPSTGLVWPSGLAIGQGAGAQVVRDSPYARLYDLSRRLARTAVTPYAFAVAVRARVQQDASYDENPPARPYPLASFLFGGDRRGYCQHFSGVMALMLRMGGVPARVASGFSPGSFNSTRKEYVVRDTDAHSWVEAYFPPYGWVTLDPTPAAAPARSQVDDQRRGGINLPGAPNLPGLGQSGDRPFAPGDPGAGLAPQQGGTNWSLVVAAALAALAGIGLAVWLWRRRVPLPPVAPELAELQRALYRSGRPPAPGMTLARLEAVLGGTDAAAAYVRAVRDQRYRGKGRGPTSAQRRALRHQLATGLGARGRLLAWWSLPPQWPSRRRLGAP
jgi:transglutaminase-like putative cysteine protease